MITVGVFADKPFASTGFSVVCSNLSRELAKAYVKVIYFGRFGYDEIKKKPPEGFTPIPDSSFRAPFLYVPCIGGVWQKSVVKNAITHYKVDAVFSEDDWFSARGIAKACEETGKPFHFLTPIDSLPLKKEANKIFEMCHTIYVPNSSYKIVQKRGYNSVFFPHGVDGSLFIPPKAKCSDFVFLWVGRDDFRKAFGRVVLAVERTLMTTKEKFSLLAHIDWKSPQGKNSLYYIKRHNLPIMCSQMSNMPHKDMLKIIQYGHVNICSARAGGFEMGVTEAAACGVPSLVTDWTFMRENIIHGKTGFRIPWSNLLRETEYGRIWANISIDKLAEKMVWCLDNRESVAKMGLEARQFVTARFKWDEIGSELLRRITESVK